MEAMQEQPTTALMPPPAPLREWAPLDVGATVYLAADEINVDHDANSRRYSAGKIGDMATSLLVNGQLQPVKITSTTRRLGLGYRRVAGTVHINENKLYKASMFPNLEPNANGRTILVRCEVIPELSELELYEMNMAENDDREDTTPIDKANQAKRLTDAVEVGGFGKTQKECAESMSRGGKKFTQSTVSKYLKVLAEAPAWAIRLVHEGKRSMETLIECVGHPAGSAERDTAMAAFKDGDSGAKVKAKVRETAGDDEAGEGEGEAEAGKAKKKKTIRSRAELIAAFEAEAFVAEGVAATPYEELWGFLLKFAAGKLSAKKLQTEVALRVKKTLPKGEAA